MTAVAVPEAPFGDPADEPALRRTRRLLAVRHWRPGVVAGEVFLVLLLLAAVWPGLFTSIDPNHADIANTLSAPSSAHWFGTDQNGRDVYARIIYGARLSLLIGLGASALALVVGSVIGVLAAQGGRALDAIVNRLLEIFLSIPGLLLVLLVIAVLGPSTRNSIIGLAILMAPGYARVTRGEVIRVRTSGFVEAAHALGWRHRTVVWRHIVPNAVGPVFILATIGVGAAIGAGSSLSFLGLGPQGSTAEWGAMLSTSRGYFSARVVDGGLPRPRHHLDRPVRDRRRSAPATTDGRT